MVYFFINKCYTLEMKKIVKKLIKPLFGEIEIPADKSISHRAVMFASLAKGKSVIKNFSTGRDCLSTVSVCKALGVDIEFKDNNNTLIVNSCGSLSSPNTPLDCGNSGTTMRLMSGILAGQNFEAELIGDESLSKRPMKRVIEPLSSMGASILSNNEKAPLKIFGQKLHGIVYHSKLSSAQVKSCVLLAGLFAENNTTFNEPEKSRDHTERMLKAMGANILTKDKSVTISSSQLNPIDFCVPGDISSAAFFIVAALLVPDSDIVLKNVGINPTRTGIIDVVKRMGGNLELLNQREELGEPIADIRVRYSTLNATEIYGAEIPRLIDEIPIITLLATQANGQTVIRNAEDLRNKESDRISTVSEALTCVGADITETFDGFIINGCKKLHGGIELKTYHDHRLAMMYYILGLITDKPISIDGFEWSQVSFPEFEPLMEQLQNG